MEKSLMDFNYNLSEEEQALVKLIKDHYRLIEAKVNELCPPSRRRSEALTLLETSQMFAVKSAVMKA